jgi:hypothetical protein
MTNPGQNRLDKLREWRNPKAKDVTLGFLDGYFKQQIAKPYKQLKDVVAVWEQIIPAELQPFTRLESFSRGVLTVEVDSSARLYELDQQLRGGLERQLIEAFTKGALRRVKLRVAG